MGYFKRGALIERTTTTVTSATPVTLANNSTTYQRLTGLAAQTIVLPAISTLDDGQKFIIQNRSDAAITVKLSDTTTTLTTITAGHERALQNAAGTWDIGSEGGGGGDGVGAGKSPADGFTWLTSDPFDVGPADSASFVDPVSTQASYNSTGALYQMACSKMNITSSGAAFSLSGVPSFTPAPGDIVWSSGQNTFRRVVTYAYPNGTLDTAFPADASGPGMISQAVWTQDLVSVGDAAQRTRAMDIHPGTDIPVIHVEYNDSLAVGDASSDYIASAQVVVSASNYGLQAATGTPTSDMFTAPFVRPIITDEVLNYALADHGDKQRLFLVFFPNPSNAAVTAQANLLDYDVSMYAETTLLNGGVLGSAYCMSDGSGTPNNCLNPVVVGGKTRITLGFNFVPGLNSGKVSGDLAVYLDGKKIPRWYDGVIGAYWKEVSGTTDTIEFWDDLSSAQYSIEIERRQGSIDTSDQNTLTIAALQTSTAAGFAAEDTKFYNLLNEYSAGDSGTAQTIDLSVATNQKVRMTGNCTFSLTNAVVGTWYSLRLVQDSTGGRTMTWSSGVKWAASAPSAQTQGKTTLVRMYFDGSFFLASYTEHLTTAGWPFGNDGNLTITSGQTVTLTPGQIKDYTNLTIDAGGKLALSGGGWMRIGVNGNLVINGSIEAITNGDAGGTYTINEVAADGSSTGSSIFYQINQGSGGGGGAAFNDNSGIYSNAGGAQAYGNGGGGAGGDTMEYDPHYTGYPGSAASLSASGAGGGGQSGAVGGAAVSVYGNAGNPGSGGGDWNHNATGGSGGSRGLHGGGIWIYCTGTVSGSGYIKVSGSPGGAGGAGGSSIFDDTSQTWTGAAGGAGGGGGAGGSGGHVVIKAVGLSFPAGNILTTPGSGGGSGSGGVTTIIAGPYIELSGQPGGSGQSGNVGSYTMIQM